MGRVGADLGYNFQSGSTLVRPVLRAAYMYDFVGDQVETTSTFVGDTSGTAFKTKNASPEKNAYDIGASINFVRASNVTLSADYDYLGKSDLSSHSGVIRARLNF